MEINGDKRSHMFLRLSRNHFKNVTVFCQKKAELYRHLEKEHPDKFEKQKANKKLPYTEENGMFKCTTCSKLINVCDNSVIQVY